MQTVRRTTRLITQTAVLAAATLAATQCGSVLARAADGNGIAGYQSAQQVLQSNQVRDAVSRFLVSAAQAGSAAGA
ncbi:hypothetical protein, partial [Kitasatospora sp. NPDC093558]|uniref:hypothetical protein n=1 Tax=Kitasatospora sp. NPDC093558 TaxID=3155201 RepID=UPI00344AB5E5